MRIDLSLRSKLICGFAVTLTVALGLDVYLLAQQKATNEAVQYLYAEEITGMETAAKAHTAMAEMRIQIRQHILVSDPAATAEAERALRAEETHFAESLGKLRAGAEGEELQRLTKIDQDFKQLVSSYDSVMTASSKGTEAETREALRLLTVARPVADAVARSLDEEVEKKAALAEATVADIQKSGDRSEKLSIALILLLVVGSGALALWLARNINAGLSRASQQMSGAAAELSSVSSQLTGNARETAAQTEAVSAAVTEMEASVREIAANASEASAIASAAVDRVDEASSRVAQLGAASLEIESVIEVITSVASQTNLLALNATVEAARAGDAGKGFAVVASEVKELAKQTAQATERISQKIAAIQSETNDTTASITGIAEVIRRINDMQGAIAAAVEEQTATTSDIARNVDDVSRAVRETSVGAGTTNAVAMDVADASRRVQEIITGRRKSDPAASAPETLDEPPYRSEHIEQPRRTYLEAADRSVPDRSPVADGRYRI